MFRKILNDKLSEKIETFKDLKDVPEVQSAIKNAIINITTWNKRTFPNNAVIHRPIETF